jgi:hypothetical protein
MISVTEDILMSKPSDLVQGTLDMRILVFALAICFATGVIIGLIPGFQASRTHLLNFLSGSGVSVSRRLYFRLRHLILIPQICLSLALLIVAGGLMRPLLKTELSDQGY